MNDVILFNAIMPSRSETREVESFKESLKRKKKEKD